MKAGKPREVAKAYTIGNVLLLGDMILNIADVMVAKAYTIWGVAKAYTIGTT